MARARGAGGIVLLLVVMVLAIVGWVLLVFAYQEIARLRSDIDQNQEAFKSLVIDPSIGDIRGQRFGYEIGELPEGGKTRFRYGPEQYQRLGQLVKWAFAGMRMQELVLGAGVDTDVYLFLEQKRLEATGNGHIPEEDKDTVASIGALVDRLLDRCNALKNELEQARRDRSEAQKKAQSADATRAKAEEAAKTAVAQAKEQAAASVAEAKTEMEKFKARFTDVEKDKNALAEQLRTEENERKAEVEGLNERIGVLKEEIARLRMPPPPPRIFKALGHIQQASLSDNLIFVGGGKDVGLEPGQHLVVYEEDVEGNRRWKAELRVSLVKDLISQVTLVKKGRGLVPIIEGDPYVTADTWERYVGAGQEEPAALPKVEKKAAPAEEKAEKAEEGAEEKEKKEEEKEAESEG